MKTEPTGGPGRVAGLTPGAIFAFLAIAFGFSWLQWLAVIAASRGWIGVRVPLTPLGSFGPGIAAFIVLGVAGEKGDVREWLRSFFRWRVPPWTALAACLVPPAAAAASFLAAAEMRGVFVRPKLPSRGFLLAVTLEVLLLGGPLGEEPGWRGFLLPWLANRWGALRAALAVGIVWFAWHVPLFWVPGAGQQDIPPLQFAVALLSYSVIATWLFQASRGSTLVAIVLHTSINVTFVMAAAGILEKGQARLFWPIYLGAMVVIAGVVALFSRVFRRPIT